MIELSGLNEEIAAHGIVMRGESLDSFLGTYARTGEITLYNSNTGHANVFEPKGEQEKIKSNKDYWKAHIYNKGSISFTTSRTSYFFQQYFSLPGIVIFFNTNMLRQFGRLQPYSSHEGRKEDQMEFRFVLRPKYLNKQTIVVPLNKNAIHHIEVVDSESGNFEGILALNESIFLDNCYGIGIPIYVSPSIEMFQRGIVTRSVERRGIDTEKYKLFCVSRNNQLMGLNGTNRVVMFGKNGEGDVIGGGFINELQKQIIQKFMLQLNEIGDMAAGALEPQPIIKLIKKIFYLFLEVVRILEQNDAETKIKKLDKVRDYFYSITHSIERGIYLIASEVGFDRVRQSKLPDESFSDFVIGHAPEAIQNMQRILAGLINSYNKWMNEHMEKQRKSNVDSLVPGRVSLSSNNNTVF